MDGEKVRYSLRRTSKHLCLHFTFAFNIKLSCFVYATNVNVSFTSSGTSEVRSLANLTRSFAAPMVNCQYFDRCAKMVSKLKLNLVTSRPIQL